MFVDEENTDNSGSTVDCQSHRPRSASPFFHTLHEHNYTYAHSPSSGQVVGRILALLQRESELTIWRGLVVFPVWNGCTSDDLLYILCVCISETFMLTCRSF